MNLARELTVRCPAGTRVHAHVQPGVHGFEAHVDLRFPRHQVIFNAAAASAEAAARDALARLGVELWRLRMHDASLFPFDTRQAA